MTPSGPAIRQPSIEEEYDTDEGCAILETWNRAEDPSVSIARARVPGRSTTRWHRLIDIVERYLIVSGRGQVEIGGLAPTLLRVGDLVYIPAGFPQRITNPDTQDLVFYAICTPRFVPQAYEDLEETR